MNPLIIGIIAIAVLAVFFLVSNNRNQPTTTLMPMRLPTPLPTRSPIPTPTPTQSLKDKYRQFWTQAGCTAEPVWNEWYDKQNEETLKKDANYWARLTGDYHRTKCYGLDKRKWPTVRQSLEKVCPLETSEKRADGEWYVEPGGYNPAKRDDYLFSGCKDAGTCNGTNFDLISQNIIDSIPDKHGCGSWILGDYEWSPHTKKFFVRNK